MQAVGYAISCKLVALIISHYIRATTRPGIPTSRGVSLKVILSWHPSDRGHEAGNCQRPGYAGGVIPASLFVLSS
jgi:hypothetical protein